MIDPSKIIFGARAPDNDETRKAREAANTDAARLLKKKLAYSYRVIADQKLDDGVAGHISLRVPDAPHHFWVANLGTFFAEVSPDSLALVNHKGEILEGGPVINLAGFLIHSAIHEVREDVMCAVHTHARSGCAFSSLRRPLGMVDQNCCSFADDFAIYDDYTGIVLDPEQTNNLASALGDKRAFILRNHGLITVADTVEQATIDMIDLERACDQNLKALASGIEPTLVPPEQAQQARSVLSQPARYVVQWDGMIRDMDRRGLGL